MKRHFKVVIALMTILMACTSVQAKKKVAKPRPFYDSKSWIVNVAGDYEILQQIGLKEKINPVNMEVPDLLDGHVPDKVEGDEIARRLSHAGYGKMMINALTENGTSDYLLKRLALANAQRSDMELGAASIRANDESGLATLIADDYEPILTHNYIVMQETTYRVDSNGQKCYNDPIVAIFKVDIDAQTAFDIVASIGDKQAYNLIDCPVTFCYATSVDPILKAHKAESEIAAYVPDLALRGVLLHRAPCRISIGSNSGLKKGDLVSFYSQRIDKKGVPYSKRISRARVGGIWDNEAQVNFEAGTSGNRKNGDIVVRTPDNHDRFVLAANWTPHVWGGHIMLDSRGGFTRSGIINHFLMDLGFNMTDKPGNEFYRVEGGIIDTNYKYLAPMYWNIGMGYGIGKTFLGFFDVMPFFIAQYEMGFMPNKKVTILNDDNAPKSHTPVANTIRVPIGVRLSVNMGYPVRFFVEGGYALRLGFGEDYKRVKQAEEYIGAKRNGIFLNVGFQF